MTGLDLRVQDLLYNMETGSWMVDRKAPVPRLFFYSGIKGAIIAFGVAVFGRYLLSFAKGQRRRHGMVALRQKCLMVILSVTLVPTTIATLKATTNMYCPSQIDRYGGDKPYVKLFDAYPEDCRRCDSGRCFPAGHASGGFSLLVLCHVFRKKRHKMAGLGVGLILGWLMGGYQMMKGAHFLSHTVVTMITAWILILCIVEVVGKVHQECASGGEVCLLESG
jgi:membrane-associated PAP2 superfamily phosphatase